MTKFNHDARESQAPAQPVVSDSLDWDARWRAIYDLADQAGRKAMDECVPNAIRIEGQVYLEGNCGDAFIIIRDSRISFARWLKKNGLGTRHYRSGYWISTERTGQAADLAKAYADAIARVLRRN